jgi:hypothetical protein
MSQLNCGNAENIGPKCGLVAARRPGLGSAHVRQLAVNAAAVADHHDPVPVVFDLVQESGASEGTPRRKRI